MRRSEVQCLGILETEGFGSLSQYEAYRAHVALANNGLVGEAEDRLSKTQRSLLEVRRIINRGELDRARAMVSDLRLSDPLQIADRDFILATISHRAGDLVNARILYFQAAQNYSMGSDEFRRTRAVINARISENNADHYFAGPLYALQQEAGRNGFKGLVGIIEKARAGELLSRGRFSEATVEAMHAIQNLTLDSCPEDLAVARWTAALSYLMIGDLEAAKSHSARIYLNGGKLDVYRSAYQDLLSGKVPEVPTGHPLEGTPWARFSVKKGSIPGKILQRLKKGPASPDQLIEEIWGRSAIHPSYRNRLFVAINKLKKTFSKNISFDGQVYTLL